MGGDFFLADGKGLLLPLAVVGGGLVVVVGGDTRHAPQGLDHALVGYLVVALHAPGVLNALGGFHHHIGVGLHLEALRVKVIVFGAAAKADADHFCHWLSSILRAGGRGYKILLRRSRKGVLGYECLLARPSWGK